MQPFRAEQMKASAGSWARGTKFALATKAVQLVVTRVKGSAVGSGAPAHGKPTIRFVKVACRHGSGSLPTVTCLLSQGRAGQLQ